MSDRGKHVLLFFFLLLPSTLLAFNETEPFDVEADTLTYRHASQDMVAEGNVRVIQGSSTLSSDYLLYNRALGRLHARGNVILREKLSLLSGSEMEYDLALEKGTLLGG